jgi:hypothetical protein
MPSKRFCRSRRKIMSMALLRASSASSVEAPCLRSVLRIGGQRTCINRLKAVSSPSRALISIGVTSIRLSGWGADSIIAPLFLDHPTPLSLHSNPTYCPVVRYLAVCRFLDKPGENSCLGLDMPGAFRSRRNSCTSGWTWWLDCLGVRRYPSPHSKGRLYWRRLSAFSIRKDSNRAIAAVCRVLNGRDSVRYRVYRRAPITRSEKLMKWLKPRCSLTHVSYLRL